MNPSLTIDLILNRGIDNQYYKSTKIPNAELVEGKKGDYYLIDLKDAETKEVLLFNIEEYTIDNLDKRFSKSITSFYKEILQVLQSNNRNIDIFIKGSADIRGDKTFKKQITNVKCQTENFLSISVHPEIKPKSELYGSNFVDKSIQNKVYTNKDLPNLRARFMQCKLQETYEELTPEILDGNIVAESGDEFLSASLILFVESTPVQNKE